MWARLDANYKPPWFPEEMGKYSGWLDCRHLYTAVIAWPAFYHLALNQHIEISPHYLTLHGKIYIFKQNNEVF